MSTAEQVALKVLGVVLEAVPSLVGILARGVADDDSPIADAVRSMLPEEGASAAARRELERRSGGG